MIAEKFDLVPAALASGTALHLGIEGQQVRASVDAGEFVIDLLMNFLDGEALRHVRFNGHAGDDVRGQTGAGILLQEDEAVIAGDNVVFFVVIHAVAGMRLEDHVAIDPGEFAVQGGPVVPDENGVGLWLEDVPQKAAEFAA